MRTEEPAVRAGTIRASTPSVYAGGRSRAATLGHLVVAARPMQWQKNVLLFAALIFSAGAEWSIGEPGEWIPMVLLATAGFLLFNAITSGEYLINDAIDVERDQEHPRKRLRPIAAGLVSARLAFGTGTALVAGAVLVALAVDATFGLVALAYAALTFVYSTLLKHLVIVDVLAIASGFALRAVAGAVVIAVPVSPWLLVCTTLGALFIAVAKRHQELVLLGAGAGGHRSVLHEYSVDFLDQMSSVAAAATIVAYTVYVTTADNLPENSAMLPTLPFVLFGVFRYRLLAVRQPERNADELIVRDAPLLVSVVLFALTAFAVLLLNR